MSVCQWRVSSENSLVELDFLKALSLQRWIECKICKALWKISCVWGGVGVKESRVTESVRWLWCKSVVEEVLLRISRHKFDV